MPISTEAALPPTHKRAGFRADGFMTTTHRPTRVLIKRASLSPHDTHTQPIYWALPLDDETIAAVRQLHRAWELANTACPINFVTSEQWYGTPFHRTAEIEALLGSALSALDTYPTVVVELTEALDVALEDAEVQDLDPVYIECHGTSITLWAIVDDADTRATASEILLLDQLHTEPYDPLHIAVH
ncbi:MAG TPA: hypothetical protein VFZ66_28005 [Herpetosiphonaceae bacterium]